MTKKGLIFTVMIVVVSFLVGCQFNFPADSKTEPHLYDEALAYIQNYLGSDDVILKEETVVGEDEYGNKYTHYYARFDGLDFIVSSQERWYYERLGEFRRRRYNLYNNYNYEMIHLLFEENQNYPNFELIIETNPYLHIYNITYFNYKPIITNEDDLIEAFYEAKMMYEWMIDLYPSPRYCVKIPVFNSDRTLFLCAHQDDTSDNNFGFNSASLEALIDEYRRFYK